MAETSRLENELEKLAGSEEIGTDAEMAGALKKLIDAEREKPEDEQDADFITDALEHLMLFCGADLDALCEKGVAGVTERVAEAEKRRRMRPRIIASVSAAACVCVVATALTAFLLPSSRTEPGVTPIPTEIMPVDDVTEPDESTDGQSATDTATAGGVTDTTDEGETAAPPDTDRGTETSDKPGTDTSLGTSGTRTDRGESSRTTTRGGDGTTKRREENTSGGKSTTKESVTDEPVTDAPVTEYEPVTTHAPIMLERPYQLYDPNETTEDTSDHPGGPGPADTAGVEDYPFDDDIPALDGGLCYRNSSDDNIQIPWSTDCGNGHSYGFHNYGWILPSLYSEYSEGHVEHYRDGKINYLTTDSVCPTPNFAWFVHKYGITKAQLRTAVNEEYYRAYSYLDIGIDEGDRAQRREWAERGTTIAEEWEMIGYYERNFIRRYKIMLSHLATVFPEYEGSIDRYFYRMETDPDIEKAIEEKMSDTTMSQYQRIRCGLAYHNYRYAAKYDDIADSFTIAQLIRDIGISRERAELLYEYCCEEWRKLPAQEWELSHRGSAPVSFDFEALYADLDGAVGLLGTRGHEYVWMADKPFVIEK